MTIGAGSPWPPGTIVGVAAFRQLTGTIAFTPREAVSGTQLAYTATLTNPNEHWLFVAMDAFSGLSVYLYTPGTEDSNLIPRIVNGPNGSAEEFRHQTMQGLETGLLLAPHASYQFSGQAYNGIESWATTDYVAFADIISTPPGVADAAGEIVRDAGTFRVLVPPPPTTTTTTGG